MRIVARGLIACAVAASAFVPARSPLAAGAEPACTPVVVVQGTASTPNKAERDYAASVTRRLTRWLTEMNLLFRTLPDEGVSAQALASARAVILGYNPFPPRAEQDALHAFAANGGKIIVFYGADPAFASWMGFRMGKVLNAPGPQRWRKFRFLSGAPANLPLTVMQESKLIRPVIPSSEQARIIATWEGENGQGGGDPAWLQSPRGFWMTHVLLDDGDSDNKKQMLLALLGACDPGVWKPAAEGAAQRAGQVGRFKDMADAVASISREGAGVPGEEAARLVLGQAAEANKACPRLYAAGRYADVVQQSRRVNDLLVQAYGMIQRPQRGERRGVWDHEGTGLYPGDWAKTCEVLSSSGFTDVFANMLWSWQAHYPSRVVAQSAVAAELGDQLKSLISAAHRKDMKVHLWKVCWRVDRAPADELARLKRDGRLQVSSQGATLPWLCPSNVENIRLEKDAIREAVQAYAVDGVHLDYIRYPDSTSCFCSGCRQNFEASLGRRVGAWPRDVAEGSLKTDYRRWRCAQITRLVRDIAGLARDVRPGIKISAAVFGKYPSCVDSVGQDWAQWLKAGYVDFVCPMNYTTDPAKFLSYVQTQVHLPSGRGRIWPGIGVTATESRLDPAQVIDQIGVARQAGAPGFVLFSLNRTLEKQVFPVLRLGTTADR